MRGILAVGGRWGKLQRAQAGLTYTQLDMTNEKDSRKFGVMNMASRPTHIAPHPALMPASLRERRERRGWSQSRMGQLAGITRQSYAAIESGRSTPSVEVALRLARGLGCTVDELFRLEDSLPVSRTLPTTGLEPPDARRFRVVRIAGKELAAGVQQGWLGGGGPADGLGEFIGPSEIRFQPFPEMAAPSPTLVVAGCDPAFGLVVDLLRERHGVSCMHLSVGSRAALDALARGAIHVAGVHLRDPASGQYNTPWVERLLPFPAATVGFTRWQQALLLQPGNPLGVKGLGDLARPGVRFLNREPGSGSRDLADRMLEQAHISGDAVPGYLQTAATSHGGVGSAVASGAADAGVGIGAVGLAWGLHMIPLEEEPYDLIIPNHFLELEAVKALLALLKEPVLRRQVEALGGYDVSVMGAGA